ncbi:MAG TPA: hypothetical protein VK355_13710, partial [Candidatus Binatia bacterium]|nr:hypothetical protein [Candidatus Binatia bacterium]
MHVMSWRKMAAALATLLVCALQTIDASGLSNPYLAKPGEAPMKVRIGTCAVTGGFIHLYTALDHRLFDKYG